MAFSFRFHKLSFMDFVTWTFLLISLLFLICNLLNTLVFPVVAYLVYLRVCIFYPVVLGPLALRLERWKMLMLLPKLLSIPLVRNHVRYADALRVSPIPSDAGSPIMEILLFLTMTMPSFWEKNASFSGSTFEWDNFHPHNTLPDRPCTAFFFYLKLTYLLKNFTLMESMPATSVKCLQKNPAGHCYITFSTDQDVIVFVKSLFSSLVVKHLIFISCLLHAILLSGIMAHLLNCLMKLLHTVMNFLAKLNTTAGHFTI